MQAKIAAVNELSKYRPQFIKSYLRKNRLQRFASASQNALMIMYKDLNDEGKDLNVPIVYPLKNSGTGTGTLSGNEAGIKNTSLKLRPVWRRNAVSVAKSEQKKASIDMYKAQRDGLETWSGWDYKYRTYDALSAVAYDETRFDETNAVETWVPYAAATAAQRNAFVAANADRVYFGSGAADLVSGNMAASLANVGGAGDRLSRTMIDNLKALAMTESRTDELVNAIRPIEMSDSENQEFFILLAPTRSFNHLKGDMEPANTSAQERGTSNIVFKGGDLEYNSVRVVEIPELPILAGVGQAAGDVCPLYFCGAQAMAVAWGQAMQFTKDANDDYGFLTNVGTEEQRSIGKVMFNGRQHGMISVFAAG